MPVTKKLVVMSRLEYKKTVRQYIDTTDLWVRK